MRDARREGVGVSLTEACTSADLGCSSEYSMENIEGRSGEGFRQQQLDTGQSVLRQGVIARLKADSDLFGGFYRFCRKGMREHSATWMQGNEAATQ